ncbi:MAG: Hpt domain-containing protein, partial [Gloeotrichia echinulata HAB0833]
MDNKQDMGDLTILDLFRLEVEAQAAIFKEGLLALETQPQSSQTLESLMRAAHAVKGVADLVEIDAAASLSHSLEEYFVTAQNQTITLAQIPVLRLGVDALLKISQVGEADLDLWLSEHHQEISTTTQKITALLTGTVEIVVSNIHREITELISPPPPPRAPPGHPPR